MKLTKEDIQFIDNYLYNSDVIYTDVRIEMVDHIATEIEHILEKNKSITFYDAFKNYMIKNKASLLNNNKKFIKQTDKKIVVKLLKEATSIKTLLVFISALFFSYQLINNIGVVINKKNLFVIPFFIIIPLAAVYFFVCKRYKVSRFSGVERLGFFYSVTFQVFHLISILIKPSIEKPISQLKISIVFSLCLTLIYLLIKVSFTIISAYNSKYKIKV